MKGERLHEGLELPRDVLPPMVVTETIRHNPWYTVTAGCFFINGRGWMERRFLLSIWKNVKTIFLNDEAVSSVFAWHLGSVGHGLSIRRWWIKLVERIVSDKLYLEWWKKNCYMYIYTFPFRWLLDRFVKSIFHQDEKRLMGWFLLSSKLSTGLTSAARLILAQKTKKETCVSWKLGSWKVLFVHHGSPLVSRPIIRSRSSPLESIITTDYYRNHPPAPLFIEISFRSIEGNSFGGFVLRGGGSIFMSGWMWMWPRERKWGKRVMELLNESCRSIRWKGSRCRWNVDEERTCDCDPGWNDPSSAPRTPVRGTPTRVRADLVQDAEASGPSAKTGRDHWKIY